MRFVGFSKGSFAACVMLGSIARADTVNISSSKDNTLFEDPAGALSNGAGPYYYAGKTGISGGNRIRRGLMAFNIAGSIPAGSTINSAALTCIKNTPAFQGNQTISLHKVLADWGEGTSNAGDPGGFGASSTANDATWIHRFFNTILWTTAGGDFAATATASIVVTNTDGPYTWASNPQMVADVQDWLDNPANDFGWIIRGNEVTNSTAVRFCTKENSIPANHPSLTVDFTPPLQSPAVANPGLIVFAVVLTMAAAGALRRQRGSN